MEHDLIVMLGAIAAAAFALARVSMLQQRSLVQQVLSFWESAMDRQGATQARIAESMDEVKLGIRKANSLLSRLATISLKEEPTATDHQRVLSEIQMRDR